MADDSAQKSADAADKAAQTKVSENTKEMHVKVYAPFKNYFDGQAFNITAVNATGPFDILPRHHNFMTLLSEGEIIVRHEKGEEKIDIQRGIMHVKANEVIVFLDV